MYEHWNNLFMITTMTIIELWVSVKRVLQSAKKPWKEKTKDS